MKMAKISQPLEASTSTAKVLNPPIKLPPLGDILPPERKILCPM
jgi:hypothetical protein